MTTTMVNHTRQRLDSNRAGVIERPGLRMFVSYQTIIGLQSTRPELVAEFGDAPVFTSQKYSPTTSRHLNRFREVYGGTMVGQGRFLEYVNSAVYADDTLAAAAGF